MELPFRWLETIVRHTEFSPKGSARTALSSSEAHLPSPSPGNAITLRVQSSSSYSATTELAWAVADTGAQVTAFDIVESRHDGIVVDVTCNTTGEEHAQLIADTPNARDGVTVRKVSDRTFLLHLGGKLSAAEAIANCVSAEELNPSYIVPSVFDPGVAPAVAAAVTTTARES